MQRHRHHHPHWSQTEPLGGTHRHLNHLVQWDDQDLLQILALELRVGLLHPLPAVWGVLRHATVLWILHLMVLPQILHEE